MDQGALDFLIGVVREWYRSTTGDVELLPRSREALFIGNPAFDETIAALPAFRLIPLLGAPGVTVLLDRGREFASILLPVPAVISRPGYARPTIAGVPMGIGPYRDPLRCGDGGTFVAGAGR